MEQEASKRCIKHFSICDIKGSKKFSRYLPVHLFQVSLLRGPQYDLGPMNPQGGDLVCPAQACIQTLFRRVQGCHGCPEVTNQ